MKIIRLTYFDVTIFRWYCLRSVSRGRSDDLFYKYNHIIYRITQTDPSNLPIYFFFQTKINARSCFEEDLVYPFAFPPSLLSSFLPCIPSPPSTLPKVISAGNLSLWRESRRHFLADETKRARWPISLFVRRIIGALFYHLPL